MTFTARELELGGALAQAMIDQPMRQENHQDAKRPGVRKLIKGSNGWELVKAEQLGMFQVKPHTRGGRPVAGHTRHGAKAEPGEPSRKTAELKTQEWIGYLRAPTVWESAEVRERLGRMGRIMRGHMIGKHPDLVAKIDSGLKTLDSITNRVKWEAKPQQSGFDWAPDAPERDIYVQNRIDRDTGQTVQVEFRRGDRAYLWMRGQGAEAEFQKVVISGISHQRDQIGVLGEGWRGDAKPTWVFAGQLYTTEEHARWAAEPPMELAKAVDPMDPAVDFQLLELALAEQLSMFPGRPPVKHTVRGHLRRTQHGTSYIDQHHRGRGTPGQQTTMLEPEPTTRKQRDPMAVHVYARAKRDLAAALEQFPDEDADFLRVVAGVQGSMDDRYHDGMTGPWLLEAWEEQIRTLRHAADGHRGGQGRNTYKLKASKATGSLMDVGDELHAAFKSWKPLPESTDTEATAKLARRYHLAPQDWPSGPTGSPEFKAWFGDWEDSSASSSGVVKPDGTPAEQYGAKPIVAYHGTASGGFRSFSKEKDKGGNLYGRGFYFTEDVGIAKLYTEKDAKEKLASVTGFRDPDGTELHTLTPAQVSHVLASVGYNDAGDGPPAEDAPGTVLEDDLYRRKQVKGPNPNWGPNVLNAAHLARKPDGSMDIAEFMRQFWKPDRDARPLNKHGTPSQYRPGSVIEDMTQSHMAGTWGSYLTQSLLGAMGLDESGAILPDSQVYEVYLNIRKPLDMEAEATPEQVSSFSRYLRDKAIGRAEAELRSSEASLVIDRKMADDAEAGLDPYSGKPAEPTEDPWWTPEDLRAKAVDNEERLERDQRHLEALKTDTHGWSYAEDLLPNYSGKPGYEGGQRDLIDQIETSGPMLRIRHADMLRLKQFHVDRTLGQTYEHWQTKEQRPMMPAIHQTPRDTLTWGDVHYMASEGHKDQHFKGMFTDWAKTQGYDGMRHTGGWNVGSESHVVWIAFEPNQVKATSSTGFDPGTDDMFKGERGTFDPPE